MREHLRKLQGENRTIKERRKTKKKMEGGGKTIKNIYFKIQITPATRKLLKKVELEINHSKSLWI